MSLSEEELTEFELEARELIDSAEKSLLGIDAGEAFALHYDSIFRVFHNLKGTAGMLEFNELRAHMHALESSLVKYKSQTGIPHDVIDYFLKGCDIARSILKNRSHSAIACPMPTFCPVPDHSQLTPPSNDERTLHQLVLDFVAHRFADLDDHYRNRGEESERDKLRTQVLDLIERCS